MQVCPAIGGRPVSEVLSQRDLVPRCLAAGPLMRMTVWMRAVRELPLRDTLE